MLTQVIVGILGLYVTFNILRHILFNSIIIFEWEEGLKFRKGIFIKKMNSGHHWYYRFNTEIIKYDMRPRIISITGQEVLTIDGISLKLSMALNYKITDSYKLQSNYEDYNSTIYTTLQLKLREIIGAKKIDDILENRNELSKVLQEKSKEIFIDFGIDIISIDLKDIMFPGNLRQVFAQVANAKQEGLAALEKARSETAALRSLANAAKLMENNPNLIQLRMLQALGESSGNTLIVNTTGDSSIIPIKK